MERHEAVVQRSPALAELVRRKTVFVASSAVGAFALIMSWMALAGFTTLLDVPVIGGLTWAYLLGFIQFAVVLVVLHLYLRRAAEWDRLARAAHDELTDGRRST